MNHQDTGQNMSHYPLFTAACTLVLFVYSKVADVLFQFEPMVKMLTTYGSFLVFLIVTAVQMYRWWKRFQRSRSRRPEN